MSNRSTIVSGQNSHRYVVNLFYTVFQKTRDHVLDDKLNYTVFQKKVHPSAFRNN